MSELSEVRGSSEATFDFTNSRNQMLMIEAVRVAFMSAILITTLGIQGFQPEFVNIEVQQPVFILLSFAFLLHAIYLLLFEQALKNWIPTALLFAFESFFISYLIHLTGHNQSIFVFLYLVNIILCGFVFQRRGALVLALWTSIQFSVLLIIGPEQLPQTIFFSFGLNNLAFFAVAILSGLLAEQLNFMGSALKRQGRDLLALRNLNSLIIDNIASGLLTVDRNGVIVRVNRAAMEILEPISSEISGRSIDQIVPGLFGRARSVFLNHDASSEEGGVGDSEALGRRFDHVYQEPGGEKLTLEVIVSPLYESEELSGYIYTFQDLTKIRRLEFQMRQSEKMAAVGQLAAGIAHEIRNPLASISGSIQLLGASFSGRQEEEQRLMAIVLREIDRLNNLVTEFLDFVRPDALKDDPVDLNSLLAEICEFVKLNRNLRADVRQVLSLNAKSMVAGNRDKIRQAFLNMIINAYQAMQDSSDPTIEVTTLDLESKVVLKIKDHGMGIDEVGLRKIFEPFHTTKPKGTGLGLAVTHKIIESHGGRIFVESTKGVGTEFTIEFPIKGYSSLDKNALADSRTASENFHKAFRGQKRGHG